MSQCEATFFLYTRPNEMGLDQGLPISAKRLREVGSGLRTRLHLAAEVVQKLKKAGWITVMCVYEILCMPPRLMDRRELQAALRELGLDFREFNYHESDEKKDGPVDNGQGSQDKAVSASDNDKKESEVVSISPADKALTVEPVDGTTQGSESGTVSTEPQEVLAS